MIDPVKFWEWARDVSKGNRWQAIALTVLCLSVVIHAAWEALSGC
jgi:hypothetical protein